MVQSNRVTIIVDDGAVYLDEYVYLDLDLSGCDIPEDVHALQWIDNAGQIEFRSNWVSNQKITELPEWAINCVNKWEEAYQANPPA
jgi:hypothetical protein